MHHDESVLMAKLASVNTRISRFVLGTLDRDADRLHPGDAAAEGLSLAHDLIVLGKAVRRPARLHTAAWGHSYLEPNRGHVRAIENGKTVVSVVDGTAVEPAVCGAWLVTDLPSASAGFAACSVCLAVLAQEP